MDIKQQIKEHLNKRNASLTSVVNMINSFKSKNEQTTVQNINNKLTRGTIKYSEVLEIAQVLGYDIVWQEQKSNELNLTAFKLDDIVNNSSNFIPTGINYLPIQDKSKDALLEQEVKSFYYNLLLLLNNYKFPYNVEEYIKRNLSVANISFNTIPLYSFIFGHSNFLCEALSYTEFGNAFISTLTYLQNIFYQGRVDDLNPNEQHNLINSFAFFNSVYFKDLPNQKD